MLGVDILPGVHIRRLRIEDEPIKVKNKRFYPHVRFAACSPKSVGTIVAGHSRQIIPEGRKCYTFNISRSRKNTPGTARQGMCVSGAVGVDEAARKVIRRYPWKTSIIQTISSSTKS